MRRIPFLFLVAFLAMQTVWANPVVPSGLIPETGPYGSFAVLFSPDALPGVSEAAGADYLRADGRRLGALLAANTLPNYNADLVMATFSEGAIGERTTRVMAASTFDVATILLDDGSAVFAIGFTAYADAGQMMIDGQAPHALPADGDALHVVAWAETEDAAALLITSSLELIARGQPLGFVQEVPVTGSSLVAPSVYPNPFASVCTLEVELRSAASVDLAVFDALGRRVAVAVAGSLDAGIHRFSLDATDLPAGIYVARIIADGRMSTTRITRMR